MPYVDFQQLQDQIPYREFYEQYFQSLRPNPSGWAQAFCCFHPDSERSSAGHAPKKSAAINLNSGWFQCYSPVCGFSGGVIAFYQKKEGKASLRDAAMELAQRYSPTLIKSSDKIEEEKKEPLPSAETIEKSREALKRSEPILTWFRNQRNLELPILEKFNIGIVEDRIWIPIYDSNNQLVNVRKYHPMPKNPSFKIINVRGHGTARLYPLSVFAKELDSIIVCEGEWDAILCHQMGFNAVTGTSGAGTWRDHWNRYFKDLKVIIAYDNDKEGIHGGKQRAATLLPYAKEVSIALPPRVPYLFKGKHEKITKDLSDLAIHLKWDKKKFEEFFAAAKPYHVSESVKTLHAMQESDDEDKPVDVSFPGARESKNYAKPIRFAATVEGKKYVPYVVPQQVVASCEKTKEGGQRNKTCGGCPLIEKTKTLTFDHRSQEILSLIDVSEMMQKRAIASQIGFPDRCVKIVNLTLKMQNVEEITLTDTIEWKADITYELIHQTAYSLVKGIEANRPYRFFAVMYPHPLSQEVTFIIYKAEPAEQSIDKFKMTPEIKQDLTVFQADGLKGLEKKLDDIYDEFEKYWKRYELRDYFFALDLFFHSVISFHLRGEMVRKGWMDALVIGDTRTAKSTTAEFMIQHYRAGEIISAEGATFAGLVGGTQQVGGKNWSVTWGALVRNDRRAVILDEISGMKDRKITIGQLSGVRSSGVADITKIQGGRALARTRLLMLSNPVSSDNNPQTKWLSEYSQPVRSIPELIGENADIARLDFALGVRKNKDVQEKIYEMRQAQLPRKFTADRCHKLVTWAWSRKPHQVQFEDMAVTRIVECVKVHVKKYWSGIPLVLEAEHHKILAKTAVACAARFFSCDETGEHIVVKPEHVELVAKKLDAFYSSTSLAYDSFSELERKLAQLGDIEGVDVIRGAISKEHIRDQLMRSPSFQKSDIYDIFRVTAPADKQHLMNKLINLNAFKRAGSYLRPTESFLDHLRNYNNHGKKDTEEKVETDVEEMKPDWFKEK